MPDIFERFPCHHLEEFIKEQERDALVSVVGRNLELLSP